VVDAVLIDEWQDFTSAWTKLALALVRPERGGVVLAGDPMQALYRDSGMGADLADRAVIQASLLRPYRSTRQCLEVTAAMDPAMDVEARLQALDGEPVDLVWAHSAAEQAASVARDIRLLLDGNERRPQDIGVLVTRRWHMGQVQAQLAKAGVPSRTAYPKYADQFDLAEPTVKITTVHSSKGYEFDVVFLVGLEHLPNPDGTIEAERQGRSAYVGATRARDQLIMTYSKDNLYLERIRSLPETVLRRWVWPDDYPEV
jgi:superfamily I DNA/RNA helicase